MTTKKKSAIDPKLASQLADGVIKSFFAHGDLTEADLDLPDIEFYDKFLGILKRSKLGLIADHRENILSQAEIFLTNKNYDYAKVFYATFFEHSLNGLIENECQKRKIPEKTKTDIIRSVDIHGKLTWLPLLIGHKQINEKYIGIIKKLADDRNAFIHYKWKKTPDDPKDWPTDIQIEAQFKKIKLAVKYMKHYEATVLFRKNKQKLSKKIHSK
jgi:hypothetical protein